MRGDLEFTGAFECGNVGAVERVSPWEWVVLVRPDSHNERQRLWFDFKVSNAEAGQRALFTLPNMSKGKSMYREGFTPHLRSAKRPTWQRMPSDQVVYGLRATTKKCAIPPTPRQNRVSHHATPSNRAPTIYVCT
jgi:hypothetical protein